MYKPPEPLNSIEAIAYSLYERRISPEMAIHFLRALVGDDALTWPEHLAGWVVDDDDWGDCRVLVLEDRSAPYPAGDLAQLEALPKKE